MTEPHACTFNRDQRCLKGAGCAAHGIECMRRTAALSFTMDRTAAMTERDLELVNYAVGLLTGLRDKYGEDVDIDIYHDCYRVRIERLSKPPEDRSRD